MLLEKLVKKQQNLGLTDQEFAELLGVARSTWQLTRSRVRPIGRKIALGALQFTETRAEAASFLLSGATTANSSDALVAHQEALSA